MRVLETEGEPEDVHMGWLATIYNNLLQNDRRNDARRLEIEREAVSTLEGLCSSGEACDPLEEMEMLELLADVADLSDPLYRTMSALIKGAKPETVASIEGVNVNVIY